MPITQRTLLQAPTDFFFGTGGSLGNTGLSAAQALPTSQDVANLMYNTIDCGGQQVRIRGLTGTVDPGVRFSGLLVGQRGFGGVLLMPDAGYGTLKIQPSGGGIGLAMDSGAMLSVADIIFDNGVQGAAGHPQDAVMLGQGARIAFWGSNRIIQNSSSYNAITAVASTTDFFPQSFGSPIQNGGHLEIGGIMQDCIQTDQGAQIEFNVNDVHGLFEFKPISTTYRSKPYCAVAWLDAAAGVILMSGVDASNGVGGDGYKVRTRKGAFVDFGLPVNPNDLNNFISNASAPNANNLYPGTPSSSVI